MADLKISQLSDGDPAQSGDQVPVNRGGSNFRITAGSIADLADAGAPTDAPYITSATHAGLSAERVLTDTASVTWDFGTPGQAKANASAAPAPDVNAQTLALLALMEF